MGERFSREVERVSSFVTDPVVTEYVNRVGQNLVRNSDAQVPFTIKVLDSEEVNAFALPGGFLYVDLGVILMAENEAELAGVMAHEIAHVAACHVARQNTRSQIMNLASIPLIFVGGEIGSAGFLRFSRHLEMEADFLGIEYLYKAGYDPRAFTAFFERVQAIEKKKPGVLAKVSDTHPKTSYRLAKSQHGIQTLLPPEVQYKLDTSEFQEVKSRLAEFHNRHRIKEDFGRQTLRDNTSTAAKEKQSEDDDHPGLKRRDGTKVD